MHAYMPMLLPCVVLSTALANKHHACHAPASDSAAVRAAAVRAAAVRAAAVRAAAMCAAAMCAAAVRAAAMHPAAVLIMKEQQSLAPAPSSFPLFLFLACAL
ncbi:unnamed protein product [Closterium sp. NIES-64]|nr:unnamed protein product [Closterium sp. NIES-64]